MVRPVERLFPREIVDFISLNIQDLPEDKFSIGVELWSSICYRCELFESNPNADSFIELIGVLFTLLKLFFDAGITW